MRSAWVVGVIALCVIGAVWGGAGAYAVAATPERWEAVPEATTPATNRTIEGVAVVASGDVWAVGWENVAVTRGVIRATPIITHYDGAGWTRLVAPTPTDRAAYLYAVAALSATDVWAVGAVAPTADVRSFDMTPLVLHWDGTAWAVVPAASAPAGSNRAFLTTVAAISPTDIWAAGSAGNEGVVQHWNGVAWLPVGVPSASGFVREQIRWDGVSAASSQDVWLVGERQSRQVGREGVQPVVAHYNGVGWMLENTPLPPGTQNTLAGVAARTSDDVWAVGSVGTPSGFGTPVPGNRVVPFLIHRDGAGWREVPVPLPDPAASSTRLTVVAALAPDDVWVGGTYGSFVTVGDIGTDSATAFFLHWDGAAWTPVPGPPAVSPPFEKVNALAAVSPTEVWCGGQFRGGAATLLHYVG